MFHDITRSQGRTRHDRRRVLQPRLEGLEPRLLLYATTGGNWVYGSRITYSFVPDGTSVGGIPSILFQSMNAKFATASWQAQIEKAAAVWEAVANINLALVTDNGAAIGGAGNQQGDPNFGDIRIGGMSQVGSQLAFAYSTPPFNGGSLAGDMFFNTDQSWQINGTAYDLETVAIHEFGHALGMGHSAISSAVMYATYNNTKQSLAPDDSSGIQSIYGVNQPDAFDAAHSNNTSSTASVITSYINGQNQLAIASLAITGSSDPDWYFVVAPASTSSTMTATVQSSALSSLSPAIWVYNSALQFQAKATAPSSFGATVSVSLSGVTAGQGFYIKAVGADFGSSGQGTYGLLVNFSSSSQSPIAPPNTSVPAQPDQGGGSSTEGNGNGGNKPSTDSNANAAENANSSAMSNADDNSAFGLSNSEMHMISIGNISGLGEELMASDVEPIAPGIADAQVDAGPLPTSAAFPSQTFDTLLLSLIPPPTGTPNWIAAFPALNNRAPGWTDSSPACVAAVDHALQDWPS